jgi:predicted nucleic acid-binding protein
MGRFQLDTSDAALLLEAQRAGIPSIATLDADFRRAQSDFDIYTWP